VTAKGTFAFRRVRSSSGDVLPVVFDREQGLIHAGACDWLRSLQESGSSPNTVRSYGLRVAVSFPRFAGVFEDWSHG